MIGDGTEKMCGDRRRTKGSSSPKTRHRPNRQGKDEMDVIVEPRSFQAETNRTDKQEIEATDLKPPSRRR